MQSEKIAVLSGKAGGKSTVAASLSLELAKNYDVGLLDVDVHGPNLSDILGDGSIKVEDEMLIPAQVDGLKYVSMGQIASEGNAIIGKMRIEGVQFSNLKTEPNGGLGLPHSDFPQESAQKYRKCYRSGFCLDSNSTLNAEYVKGREMFGHLPRD